MKGFKYQITVATLLSKKKKKRKEKKRKENEDIEYTPIYFSSATLKQ